VPTTRALARRWVPALARRRAVRHPRVTVVGSGPDGSTRVAWGAPELDERPARPEDRPL
jgi:hypothetical protein